MPWREAPVVDFEQQPEFQWPFWEVGCREADLFGDLHQRFNTVPNPTFIQEPNAWHADVSELARTSATKDEFMSHLQRRRDERLGELQDFRQKLFMLLCSGFTSLNDSQSFHLTRLNAFATLDTIVAFYAALLAPNRECEEPSLDEFLTSDQLRHLRSRTLKSGDTPSQPSLDLSNTRLQGMPSLPGPHMNSSTLASQASSNKVGQGRATGGDRKRKAPQVFDTDQEQCCKRLRSNMTTSARAPASPSVDSFNNPPGSPSAQSATVKVTDIKGRHFYESRNGSQTTIVAAATSLDSRRAKSRSRRSQKRGAVGKQKRVPRPKGSSSDAMAAGVNSDSPRSKSHGMRRNGSPDAMAPLRRSRRIAARHG